MVKHGSCKAALLLTFSLLVRSSGHLMVKPKDCRHGVYNAEKDDCECYEGWKTAGVTDIIDHLEGVCEQYQCQSDAECQHRLPEVDSPTCPVQNWNCYCGWKWAVRNAWHGYENHIDEPGGAECMGVMYTLSVFMTEQLSWLLERAWIFFVGFATLLLPFGRKRARCDHHFPSVWNSLRAVGVSCCGMQRLVCNGECVMNAEYTMDVLKDDIAWSLYALDIGVWFYLFVAVLLLVFVELCSLALWALICIALVVLIVVGAMAACVAAVGALGGGGDCNGCGLDNGCHCDGINCDGCGDCCGLCQIDGGAGATGENAIYYGGAFPYDPYWGYNGYYGGCGSCHCENNDCCCKSGICSAICRPLAWLFFVFPVQPENAWGGLCGRFLFGTHHFTPPDSAYHGDPNGTLTPLIEFLAMRWLRNGDLHGNDEWRAQVRNFLSGDGGDGEQPPAQQFMGRRFAQGRAQMNRAFTQMDTDRQLTTVGEVHVIGRAHSYRVDREFTSEDNPVASSFADYKNKECWICRESNSEWDMWLSCHHMFCAKCSTEMLQRRMPCPLCRVSSSTVLRGKEYTGEPPVEAHPSTQPLLNGSHAVSSSA